MQLVIMARYMCTYVSLLTVQLIYKIKSTCKSLTRNLRASCEYSQGYSPVKGLQGLKLVQILKGANSETFEACIFGCNGVGHARRISNT